MAAKIGVAGIVGLAVVGVAAKPVLAAFAGSAYSAGAAILPLYAIGMTLLGAASVLIATHQSRARAAFLSILLPITVAEPVLIIVFHQSLMQVVWIVTLSMGALAIGLAILMARRPARRLSDNPLSIVAVAEAQA